MSKQITRLLEIVGLLLPATAIYLQILRSSYTTYFEDAPPQETAREHLDFHLTKGSIFFLAISGLLAIGYLLGSRIPCVIGAKRWCSIAGSSVSVLQKVSIGVALFLLAGSVQFSEIELESDERSIWPAILVYLQKLWPR